MKVLLMLLVLASALASNFGCEAHGKVGDTDHDHEAKMKVKTD